MSNALVLPAYFAAGLALGLMYFRTLRWTSDRLAAGGGLLATVAVVIGRFVLLGGILALIAREGALPLLLTALGVFIARAAVLRSARMETA